MNTKTATLLGIAAMLLLVGAVGAVAHGGNGRATTNGMNGVAATGMMGNHGDMMKNLDEGTLAQMNTMHQSLAPEVKAQMAAMHQSLTPEAKAQMDAMHQSMHGAEASGQTGAMHGACSRSA
ncbi:hypothetical protein J4419_03735 [Candidatus Woesearchaeota archaeon]|nr:hypothetical protein [Candidatus Woesearchaeota archaeon]